MTEIPFEERSPHKERDADIVKRFTQDGETQASIAKHYQISRTRVHQILVNQKVTWRERLGAPKGDLNARVSVHITKDTKQRISEVAASTTPPKSISRLIGELIDNFLQSQSV